MLANSKNPTNTHNGRRVFDLALKGGAQAMGMNVGSLEPGHRADIVMLDPDHPILIAHSVDTVLDAWILSGTGNPVRDVMMAGNWVLRDRKHENEASILVNYRRAMRKLLRN